MKTLVRKAMNLGPLLDAAAAAAVAGDRPGDNALFVAAVDLLQEFVDVADVDEAMAQADALVPPAAPGGKPDKPPAHRHSYSEGGTGPCLAVVDGKPCGALSRAAKKAAATPPATPPAGGGSAS
jgi:hypothetical protein